MAKVHITSCLALDNPCSFLNPFKFEITYECIEEMKEKLEWKMVYLGSPKFDNYDQILDKFYTDPVPEGEYTFVFEANPLDITKLSPNDVIGMKAVIIVCSYREQEFEAVSYFLINDFSNPEMKANHPFKPQFESLTRNIMSTPFLTRFKIDWNDTPENEINEPAAFKCVNNKG